MTSVAFHMIQVKDVPFLKYPVNDLDAIRRAYIIKGPFKPFAHDFSKRKISGKDRGFNYCWMYSHDWLEYSIKKDVVFCFICYLFKKGARSDTFTIDGWNNWNRKHILQLKRDTLALEIPMLQLIIILGSGVMSIFVFIRKG
jgi:hypothetical protein